MAVSKDFYYKLSSEVESERLEAATGLLKALTDADTKEDWDYALNRLVKGLTSSRQSARFGFSLALTELVRILILKEDYDLTISSFLQKMVENSKVSGSMKGKEARALLFGRLFGFQAVLNSMLLLDPKTSSEDDIKEFVRHLVRLSAEKSWLRETAMFTLCQFLSAYLSSPFLNDELTLQFLQSVSDEGLTFTTEGLAVHLVLPLPLRVRIASQVKSSSHWKNYDPLSKGNTAVLAKVLKDAEVVETVDNDSEEGAKVKTLKQKGTWSPKIPFVWDTILAHFTSSEDEECDIESESSLKKRKSKSSQSLKKRAKKQETAEQIPFGEFWKVVVDETLFAERTSLERKFWGFELFNKFIAKVTPSQSADLFGKNFLRTLMNHASQNNKQLNKLSTKTLNLIILTAQDDLRRVIPYLSSILDEKNGGLWNFDYNTKSKASDSLIGVLGFVEDPNQIPEEQVELLVHDIKEILINKFEAAAAAAATESAQTKSDSKSDSTKVPKDGELKWILDKLLVLTRSTKRLSNPPTKLFEDVFKFLIEHAFFKPSAQREVSESVLKLCSERLTSLLTDSISSKRKDHSWALFCLKQIEKKEKETEFSLILELSDDLQAVKEDSVELLHTIKLAMKKDPKHKDEHFCFELLISMVLQQLYQGESEAVTVLEELKACYLETFANTDEDIETSAIMTEIILSFISKKSALLKKLCNIVWEKFLCAEDSTGKLRVTESSLKLLFNVLNAKENEAGQKQLFEGEEIFVDDEEEADGDEDEEKDDEDSEDSSDSEEDDSEDDSEKNEDVSKLVEQVEHETTIKLASALGIPASHNGEVKYNEIDSFGEDDDDYESESMDDEQMMAIDEDLARIFKERRDALTANSSKKKNADKELAKEQMVLFKSRVLDLLETFSKVQPNSVYNLHLIRPLVNVMNLTTEKDIGIKAHKILKTRISKIRVNVEEVKSFYPEEEFEEYKASLLDLLKWLQLQAGKYSSSQAHGAACNQSCIIVSKSLLILDPEMLSSIVSVYSETLTTWASESTNRIQANMFFDFVNWLNSKRGNN
ncbi:hypothetical protein PUMCH_003323 [Australozyma saopauloensis]|uniref:DNA polymerase V n=1 Tax=Australozyma saopauloensis TaxID=291208 RepID=A0AAX4HC64_9ASCO|nr:hypothetical protein PUMCH_003323 [[Candida] saopauloensis]